MVLRDAMLKIICLLHILSLVINAQQITPIQPITDFMTVPPLHPTANMQPKVTDVSAMCSPQGITAQIMFETPYYGKIYSQQYANVHECVYYNSYDMNMILFTIPNFACGTKVERNSANVISRITNEVYVQYDKETQTSADRRFLFICQLAAGGTSQSSVIDGQGGTQTNTVTPAQTIVVQTGEPTHIIVTQSSIDAPDITMEIQDGQGPAASLVQRPLKLGDTITLVVKSGDAERDGIGMFAHSCYAADGGDRRVLLVDEKGCTTRSQVAGNLERSRDAQGRVMYFFRMSAFKFPGNDDVYFTCSVDLCSTCGTKPICDNGGTSNAVFRSRRQLSPHDKSMLVHNYVKITDQALFEALAQSNTAKHCIDINIVYTLSSLVGTLLLLLIIVTTLLINFARKTTKRPKCEQSDRRNSVATSQTTDETSSNYSSNKSPSLTKANQLWMVKNNSISNSIANSVQNTATTRRSPR